MADKKISELTNITGANLADTDEFVVVDTSAIETKAITFGELKNAFDTSTGFVRITGDTMTGDLTVQANIAVTGTVDGRDVAADGSKLDGIEAGADVTDTANVTAAGALMDSELTNIAAVKALNQGVSTTDSPSFSGTTINGNITVTGTVDGRDVAADGSKLDGIEAGADVTDTANVTAAGALMDSELTNITAVKGLDQGVATTDNVAFASVQLTGGTGDEGTLTWNDSDRTLDLEQGGVTLQLGQETHFMVRNQTGSTIGNGTFLGFAGVTVGSNRIIAAPFDPITMDAHLLIGFATENISNGVNGLATTFGYVRELDTRGSTASNMAVGDETWAVGDLLYVHPTVAGKLTNVAPTSGIKAAVAAITNRHETQGEIFVRVTALNENAYATAAQGSLADSAVQPGEAVPQTAATGSAEIPTGTEAQRDGSPSAGYFRFNTETSQFEGYNGTNWGSVGGGGATGGGSDEIFIENGQTVTTDYTIPADKNAMSTGPIEINSGVTVTVSTGARWVVI